MRNFNKVITNLKLRSEKINRSFNIIAILEVLCPVLIAILSKFLEHEFAGYFIVFLIALYVVLAFLRLYNRYNPMESLLNELSSEKELSDVKSDANRLKVISNLHVEMMKNLNVQTCKLDEEEEDESHLCDTGISESILGLINPLISNSYILLNTNKDSKFTTGLYLRGYRSLHQPENEEGIVLIQDQLNKASLLSRDLIKKGDLKGSKLELQSILKHCYNNRKFCAKDLNDNDKSFTVICSPMYEACREDDDSSILLGVLFVISEKIEFLPDDLEIQFKIFNRIIANWLYSYNACIANKLSISQIGLEFTQDKKSNINGHTELLSASSE